MRAARSVLLLAVMAGGCLPPESPIDGRKVYQGRDVENMRFVTVGGRPYVSFDVRKRRRSPNLAGVVEWRLAGWEDGAPIVVVPARSDAWGTFSQDLEPNSHKDEHENGLELGDRLFYSMRDERPADPIAGIPRTGTLVISTVRDGVREQIPFVESFQTGSKAGVFFYRRPAPGHPAPDLVLRDDRGRQRVLTNVTGSVGIINETGLLFLGGSDRTLYRMASIDAPLEPLRAGVSSYFQVDGSRMILTVPDQGKPATTLFTMSSRRERRLPGDAICCLLGGHHGRFWYAEAAKDDVPVRLHLYDLDSAHDRVLELPPAMVDVARVIDRPGRRTPLLLDSAGKVVLLDLDAEGGPVAKPLAFPASHGNVPKLKHAPFTQDGSRLVYLDPERLVPEVEGRLMSTDLNDAPVQLSPEGALVQPDSFFEIGDEDVRRIVFWARYGRTVSDLYFVPPAGGDAVVVAEQIRDVSVGIHGLLGIVNASLQDLTGDLVRKNIDSGEVHVFSHAVESYTVLGDRLAFYVWNRVPSAPDGVWAVSAPP